MRPASLAQLLPYLATPAAIKKFAPGQKIVRDLRGLPASLGWIGSLEIRLAETKREIRQAQKLRWRVFFKEGKAHASMQSALRRRDICPFDRYCDHLIVLDHSKATYFGKKGPRVVGAYRLLRQDVAEAHDGFYSATEFDIAPMFERHRGKRFLELGRSCVLPEYRSKRALELLWRGIWAYVRHHRIDVLIGCASFDGVNPRAHAQALSFLRQHAAASAEWRVAPLSSRGAGVAAIASDSGNARRTVNELPPLIKGYLRLGAMFAEDAVVDYQFGTTDVFVVLPVTRIEPRYIDYFATPSTPLRDVA